ncbi:DUF4397 domain-containing protein [Amnibacterium kyonggiense]
MSRSRIRAVFAATAVAAALVLAPSAAFAAPSTGWVRVAHLSPDTTAMDVRLAQLSGDGRVVSIADVSYGSVSHYLTLAAGRYAVAMRPAGSAASSTPVVSSLVDVAPGSASTVAVFGTNAHLVTKVINDSLALPRTGDARVRIVQASTSASPVTVTASPDETIASDVDSATASAYADVAAGAWTLTATAGSKRTTTTIDLKAGQIVSVFVLDDAHGGLALRRVLDSASVGGVPSGYLATGGGYLAHRAEQQQQMTAGLAAGGLALLASAGLGAIVVRSRRARA